MSWFYYFGRFIIRIILFFFTRLKVRGRENLPENGALLVVANHLSLADPPILGACLSRKVIFMAKEELFHSPFSRYFVRGFGAFPVSRGQMDRKAIRRALEVLNSEMVLVMFPEGARKGQETYQPGGFIGSAMISTRACVPILPIGITGTENINGYRWLLKRPVVTVNIGRPFNLPEIDGKASKEELTRLTGIIMGNITNLLPTEYRNNQEEKNAVPD